MSLISGNLYVAFLDFRYVLNPQGLLRWIFVGTRSSEAVLEIAPPANAGPTAISDRAEPRCLDRHHKNTALPPLLIF